MSLHLQNLRLPLPDFTLQATWQFNKRITGLFGPSGSGKTTLLEMIAGLRQPEGGLIALNSRVLTDITARKHAKPEHRAIGYVPQDLALFPHLSAAANLYYGVQPREPSQADWQRRVIETLELAPLLSRAAARLSGGEKQRLALGRALLTRPQLLLLDEPLSSLDERLKERILTCLLLIRDEFQIPMLYVSHQRDEHRVLCDEVLTLSHGVLESYPLT